MAGRSRTRLYAGVALLVVVFLQLNCILSPSWSSSHVSDQKGPSVAESHPQQVPSHQQQQQQQRARATPVPEVLEETEEPPTSPPAEVKSRKKETLRDVDEAAIEPSPDAKEMKLQKANAQKGTPTTDATPSHHMVIHVFTYKRLAGLRRLLTSLVKADYLGHGGKVTLRIFMDHLKKSPKADDVAAAAETQAFLKKFHWPHGDLQLHRREINMGLKRSILEAWYPMSDHEVGAFFEDDVEVSPLWYAWAMSALQKYAPLASASSSSASESGPGSGSGAADPALLGISLFRPIHDELSGKSCIVRNGGNPFALQQPCSWGAVYLPQPWRTFRDWYDNKGAHEPAELRDPNDHKIRPSSNGWDSKSSWKKYLIRLIYEKGWFMIYPNHDKNQVLSTNHLMEGEHPTPPKKLFELPLVDTGSTLNELTSAERATFLQLPPLQEMVAYDVMFRKTKSGTVDTLPNYHHHSNGKGGE